VDAELYGVATNLIMKIRLTQLDGKLPNLALMKLAFYHIQRGDEIHFSRSAQRDMFEPEYKEEK